MPTNQIVAIQTQDGLALQGLSSNWVELVAPNLAPYVPVYIFGTQASRQNNSSFSRTVGGADVVLITGLGHGTTDEFFAYGGSEALYSSSPGGISPGEVTGKIVHLLSCSTAGDGPTGGLGAAFLAAGCAAFIGYQNLVTLAGDADFMVNLVASDGQVDISLAAGKSVSVAIQDAKNSFSIIGRPDIGNLLVSNPPDCTLKLPPITTTTAPNALTENVIPAHATAAANSIAARTI
jgi:hypothetical protein